MGHVWVVVYEWLLNIAATRNATPSHTEARNATPSQGTWILGSPQRPSGLVETTRLIRYTVGPRVDKPQAELLDIQGDKL